MTEEFLIDNLSIDCIIFSFQESKLHILLVKHAEGESKGEWGLPGGYVRIDEDVDAAAERLLNKNTGLDDVYLEQLKVFGEVNRHPHRRVLTVAYFALVKYTDVNPKPGQSVMEVKWFPLDNYPELIFDHKEILNYGIESLQHIVRHEPIGFVLLPVEFTLLQLQSLYEDILETKFDKPNFRRKIFKMNLLIDTGKKQKNVSHRAANLYRFDPEIYEKLTLKGFAFDL